jgi:hypothetical protein
VGLIVGLIGIWLAVRYYKKSIRSKLLAIGYTDPLPLLLPFPEVTVTYRGSTQSSISRVFVLFWNRGTAPIEAVDFIESIKIEKAEKVLGLSLFDKDAVASASISEEQKTLTVQLLRPGEAIILQIDAAEEAYRPDVSVLMKSADMTTSTGIARAGVPFLCAGIVATVFAMPKVLDVSLLPLLKYGEWAYYNAGLVFALVKIAFSALLGWITYLIVRAAQARLVSPVTARFFRLQTTVWDALPTWKKLKRKIERTTRQ